MMVLPHSELGQPEVIGALVERIQASPKGMISFRDYMDICLYQENQGYYRNAFVKIGKEGDFYTSSSVGSIMGEIVAGYLIKKWREMDCSLGNTFHIVEWGGGNGRLALHILDELKTQDAYLYNRTLYTMIESSQFHRALQESTLQEHVGRVHVQSEQQWLDEEPRDGIIVLANELLDAFPIHRVRKHKGQLEESFVVRSEIQRSFDEIWLPLSNALLSSYIEQENIHLLEDQIIEINLASLDWIKAVSKRIKTGELILIDYGDTTEELYAVHRQKGTLMCYRKHLAYDDPFIYQGEQDITSHVNFSSCIRAGLQNGFEEAILQTQREFLLEQGILAKLQEHFDPNPFSHAAKRNRSIRQLLLSDQMSELFKVLIMAKKR
jgi:SAM-dependent MidA family methyltransferase